MKYFAGLIVVIAIAAFATRPDGAALDDQIVSDLRVAASNAGVTANDNLVTGVAKFVCSMSPEECAQFMLSSMTLEVSELYGARRAAVSVGDEPALSCLGVFTQWTCRSVA